MQQGHERLLVCFVDVENWSRGIQDKPDEAVFEFLNDFYEIVLPIAEEHEGRIVKVIGDAALIIFKPRDAEKAIEAVWKMRAKFEQMQQAFEPAVSLQLSAAVDIGPAIAKEMGPPSIRRWDVIGRPVNAAARLKSKHGFVITPRVADEVEDIDLSGIEIVDNPRKDETEWR